MAIASLKASKRDGRGTHKTKRLRKDGQIPGIIYGHGIEPLAVAVSGRELNAILHHGDRLLALDIDGHIENVLVKETQYDPMQQHVIHIDLARVNLDERVRVTVTIVLRGTPAGAADGGVIAQTHGHADIECLVTDIPEEIRVSVADMKLDDVMHMKDLPMPQGARLLSDPEEIVCSVGLVAEEVVAPAAEGAAAGEPEVIGAKKEEEGEGAAEAPAKK